MIISGNVDLANLLQDCEPYPIEEWMTQMVKKSDCFVQTSKKMSIPVQDQNLAQQLACEHSTFNIIDFVNMDVGQHFQS